MSPRSMTGYGRAKIEHEIGYFEAELRSVNSRFQEIKVNLPPGFSQFETQARNLLRARIKRGKVECRIRRSLSSGETPSPKINEAFILASLEKLRELQSRAGLEGEITLEMALRMPGAFETAEEELPAAETWAALKSLLEAALEPFEGERAREGAALSRQIIEEAAVLRAGRLKIAEARVCPDVQTLREKETLRSPWG